MDQADKDLNIDQAVIDGFGQEWNSFDYSTGVSEEALNLQFDAYLEPLDMGIFDSKISIAADFGAGSGRWTSRLLPYFSRVYSVEPSEGAHAVLIRKFGSEKRVMVLKETVGSNSIPDGSLDLGMSLGVLHHIPDTSLAIRDLAKKIKPGGHFLCYLYYKLEDKPMYYRAIFRVVDFVRRGISRLPHGLKRATTNVLAALIYWPLARLSKLLIAMKIDVSNIPLHHYANMPFVMLTNDALDRFGTSLEQRFNKGEIIEMLKKADFDISTLVFSEREPFWTFAVQKNS